MTQTSDPSFWLQAFPPGMWRWVVGGTVGSLATAAGLGMAAKLVTNWPRSKLAAMSAHDASTVRAVLTEVEERLAACLAHEDSDVVRAVDELLRGATTLTASDIHFSPLPTGCVVTYRVHGSLHRVTTLSSLLAPLFVNRIKVMARLDLHVRSLPQDGRLVTQVGGRVVEARVSTLPTESGERVVLRLVRGGRTVPSLDSLGFSPQVLASLQGLLAKPQGLVFVTGPVGSGKTTTLYSALEYISQSRGETTTLVTLEDPIELELPFATQTQMHARTGMTFASALRSVLRQDPNVLMLGEIRDSETADIAMQAGLTGHLILTTVHADNAAGPFARLIDMHIEPFVLASSTIGSLSQRLVRTLCGACRREQAPEPLHRERFARLGVTLDEGPFYEPVGCRLCEGQGYTGRTPISELLCVDSELRARIHDCLPTDKLRELAIARGMVPLVEDGLRRARQGETSLAEVLRVAG